MRRAATVIVLALICLAFGTTWSPKSLAGDRGLRDELEAVKNQLVAHERRIAKLEMRLSDRDGLHSKGTNTETEPVEVYEPDKDGWKLPRNWSRIKRGMSRQQVEAVLGPPTSVDALSDSFFTLYYEGAVRGSGYVTGNIEFIQRRVLRFSSPVFSTK